MIPLKLLKNTTSAWLIPASFMLILFLTHLLINNYASYIKNLFLITPQMFLIEDCIYKILMGVCEYWLCVRLLNKTTHYLATRSVILKYPTVSIVIPFFTAGLKALSFLIFLNIVTQELKLPAELSYILTKISNVLIICTISWMITKLVDISVQLLLQHSRTTQIDSPNAQRKIYTQTMILKRMAYCLICVLTAGAVLMLFDNVRTLGASVLTTAGVMGLILTFTAQQSLASIFSGLEIALTQPIKIGDSVVIDNQNGTIEEINFRNVVVKLWDWRRLIVPINFFLEKSFQNLSRVQNTNLIGAVFLFVDFTCPIVEIRTKLQSLLKKSNFWDGNVGQVQVNDLQERAMQLKILVSAKNSDDLSNLQAYLREELMDYIAKNHSYALPKTRSNTVKNETDAIFSSKHKILQES